MVIDWDELQEVSLEKNFVESDAICCIVAHGEMLGEESVLQPDVVHVLVRGRIVASGGPELAGELERTGYAAFESAARERDAEDHGR